ncbi:hypothetical protein PR048_031442 [Dryococelus australis]|uniref:Uncharacterized protein n=1 Tax=Dryococelus australis TaxID=614101 RepID=A0ABQ9G594_9NEOP|nr:hypothetical protein PR048_031442 [Dryococelus australis]
MSAAHCADKRSCETMAGRQRTCPGCDMWSVLVTVPHPLLDSLRSFAWAFAPPGNPSTGRPRYWNGSRRYRVAREVFSPLALCVRRCRICSCRYHRLKMSEVSIERRRNERAGKQEIPEKIRERSRWESNPRAYEWLTYCMSPRLGFEQRHVVVPRTVVTLVSNLYRSAFGLFNVDQANDEALAKLMVTSTFRRPIGNPRLRHGEGFRGAPKATSQDDTSVERLIDNARFPEDRAKPRPKREWTEEQRRAVGEKNEVVLERKKDDDEPEWLDYPPSTKANRVRFPAGLLPDFRSWKSCRTTPLWGCGGVVVGPLASHLSEQGSSPGGVATGFSHVGNRAGRWHWSAGFRNVRAAQISTLAPSAVFKYAIYVAQQSNIVGAN